MEFINEKCEERKTKGNLQIKTKAKDRPELNVRTWRARIFLSNQKHKGRKRVKLTKRERRGKTNDDRAKTIFHFLEFTREKNNKQNAKEPAISNKGINKKRESQTNRTNAVQDGLIASACNTNRDRSPRDERRRGKGRSSRKKNKWSKKVNEIEEKREPKNIRKDETEMKEAKESGKKQKRPEKYEACIVLLM